MSNKVHFKDIYNTLVKRVFQETTEDFEISKYLKTQMKGKWVEKHKKVKTMNKCDFKLHQTFATTIIAKYVKIKKERDERKRKEREK
jgi:hypothetical protein